MQQFVLQVPAIGDAEPYTHRAAVPRREGELNFETLCRVMAVCSRHEPASLVAYVAAWLNMHEDDLALCTDHELFNDVLHTVAWFDETAASLDAYKLPKQISLGLAPAIDLEKAKTEYSIGAWASMQRLAEYPYKNGLKIVAQGLGVDGTPQEEWVRYLHAGVGYRLLSFFLTGGKSVTVSGMLSRFSAKVTRAIIRLNTSRLSRRITS